MNRAVLLIPVIAGATMILTAACSGAAAPTNTPAPPTPAATTAPAPNTPSGGNGGGDPVARGQTLYETAQPIPCMTCHTIDGSPSAAPTWQGIYGSEETLTDGTTVTVDEEYIRESIVDPNAKIVEGFQPDVMPQGYGGTLSDSDIDAIIAFIESLQ